MQQRIIPGILDSQHTQLSFDTSFYTPVEHGVSSSSTQTWIKSLLQNDVLLTYTYTHDDGTLRYAIDIYEKKVDTRKKIDLRGHIQ